MSHLTNQNPRNEPVVLISGLISDVLRYFVESLFKESYRTPGGIVHYPGDVDVKTLDFTVPNEVTVKLSAGGDIYNLVIDLSTHISGEGFNRFTLYKEKEGIGKFRTSQYIIDDIAVMIGLRYCILPYHPAFKQTIEE